VSFTLEAWIRTTATSLTGNQAYQGNGLIWSDVGGVANDFVFAVLNDRLSFFTGNPDTSLNGTRVLNDGNWHHVVATRQVTGTNSVLSIYVDGTPDATPVTLPSTQPLTSNPNVAIGGNTLDNRYFTGQMDEVALYNVALTAAQVQAHYITAVPEPLTPLALIGLASLAVQAARRLRAAPRVHSAQRG
jgi:Concanavalin A-like lectin/glucanases superfamily/PEP-CTERM motif